MTTLDNEDPSKLYLASLGLILEQLNSEQFESFIEQRDLRASVFVVAALTKEWLSPIPNINVAMIMCSRAIATAGYLVIKYKSLAARKEREYNTERARKSKQLREDAQSEKVKMTADALEDLTTARDEIENLGAVVDLTQELAGYFTELKSALYRLHEAFLEVSRNERSDRKLDKD